MDTDGLDTSASTARHWVGVYTQLNRVAELGESTALDPTAAIRMAETRSRDPTASK